MEENALRKARFATIGFRASGSCEVHFSWSEILIGPRRICYRDVIAKQQSAVVDWTGNRLSRVACISVALLHFTARPLSVNLVNFFVVCVIPQLQVWSIYPSRHFAQSPSQSRTAQKGMQQRFPGRQPLRRIQHQTFVEQIHEGYQQLNIFFLHFDLDS